MPGQKGTTRGFRRSSELLAPHIRKASESRGFAVSRVLTQWAEIAGPDISAIARPVEVSYGHKGLGATLTVLTTGTQASILEMQRERLRDRVNAVYGCNAIARVRITQTAPTGFADGKVAFDHKPYKAETDPPDPLAEHKATKLAAPVGDSGLRQALEALGRNILSRRKP